MLRQLALLALVASCELAEPTVDAPPFDGPVAFDRVESIRSSTTAQDPPPPKPAIALFMPGMEDAPQNLQRWFVGLEPKQRHVVRQICRARQSDPCAGMMPGQKRLDGLDEPTQIQVLMAAANEFDTDCHTDDFCRRANGSMCDTPLVVAFDAEPITFTRATADHFAFSPGIPAASDWPTASTPWIALDRDGDGAITSGAELFGDSTALPNGTTARNGFEALAALDDDQDGTIDRRDRAFASLLLWADSNGDRKSSPDELRPLASVVVSIPLAHDAPARCDDRGNCEGERGMLHWRDANGDRTGAVVDVYLPRR